MSDDRETVVKNYFEAMRKKRDGIESLIDLFDEHATYVEPFSGRGQPTSRSGKAEIAGFLRAMPENAPPDMEVNVDRIDREGENVRAEWTCTSSTFAQPMRGVDVFEIKNAKIVRLETAMTQGPDAQ